MTNKPECRAREFWINKHCFKNEVTPWENDPVGFQSFNVCTTINFSPGNTYHVIEYSAYQELKEKLEIAKEALRHYSKELIHVVVNNTTYATKDFEVSAPHPIEHTLIARQALSELERKDEPKDYSMSVDCSEIHEESIGLAKKNLMKIVIKDEETK